MVTWLRGLTLSSGDARVAAAIGRAGDWLVAEIAAFADSNPDYAGSITWGTEGGVSTYFALQAAHKTDPSGGYGEAAEALATVRGCSAIVGMHPDGAAEAIVDFALATDTIFALVPCCVVGAASFEWDCASPLRLTHPCSHAFEPPMLGSLLSTSRSERSADAR